MNSCAHITCKYLLTAPSPLRIHTSSESRDKFTTMKANDAARETPHTKKSSRASIELDMVLKTENSFQTVDDNCDAVKRQMLPSSIATPETESSSISYERPRRRKIKSKNKRQSSRLMLCGALGDEDDTIIHDAKTSLRQIVSTLKAFGPDEKEAVREVLLEGASSIKGTLKKFAGQCGKRTP